ncbi:MAG: hypothetical protein IT350_07575 [Deltaproteobacteria bacterium]|nr:hypothetical protein [Deltaproteobacteria bacterium]
MPAASQVGVMGIAKLTVGQILFMMFDIRSDITVQAGALGPTTEGLMRGLATLGALILALFGAIGCSCGGEEESTGRFGGANEEENVVPQCDYGDAPLQGFVLAPDGETHVGGATVEVPELGLETMSDVEGYYSFESVEGGFQQLTARKGEYVGDASAQICAGEDNKKDVIVRPPPHTIAVVPGDYDTVQEVLKGMGFVEGTDFDMLTPTDLEDEAKIGTYTYLFLNCTADPNVEPAGSDDDVADDDTVDDDVADDDVTDDDMADDDTVATSGASDIEPLDVGMVNENLFNFVQAGGRLYASDWSFEYVEYVWPDAISFPFDPKIGPGSYEILADVVDADLAEHLGKTQIEIYFDLPIWVVMDGVGEGTSVLVRGSFATEFVSFTDIPLLARFDAGEGRVTYTSFHNEAQVTDDVYRLLSYLMFNL